LGWLFKNKSKEIVNSPTFKSKVYPKIGLLNSIEIFWVNAFGAI